MLAGFHLNDLEEALAPFAVLGGQSLQNVFLLETVVELRKDSFLCAFQFGHTHTADHPQHCLQLKLSGLSVETLLQGLAKSCSEVIASINCINLPKSLRVKPYTYLLILVEERLENSLQDPSINRQQDVNSPIDNLIINLLVDLRIIEKLTLLRAWQERVDLFIRLLAVVIEEGNDGSSSVKRDISFEGLIFGHVAGQIDCFIELR